MVFFSCIKLFVYFPVATGTANAFDEEAYQYFLDIDANVYGDKSDFDGVHGISVYNRTRQTKEESDDSTFMHPDFTRMTIQKDAEEWIIAVGRHEGFIPARDWIAAQKLKEEIFNVFKDQDLQIYRELLRKSGQCFSPEGKAE